jgi:hypothetical protein
MRGSRLALSGERILGQIFLFFLGAGGDVDRPLDKRGQERQGQDRDQDESDRAGKDGVMGEVVET